MGVVLPNRGGDYHNKGTPLKWHSKNTDVRHGWKLDYESLSTKNCSWQKCEMFTPQNFRLYGTCNVKYYLLMGVVSYHG